MEKCITDITEIPASDGKLYVSAIFNCFALSILGLAVETNMKADLCIQTSENALTAQKDRFYRKVRKLKEETAGAETVKRCIEQVIPLTEQIKEKSKTHDVSL